MEIHKPKAVHSWREFLKEIGTIVIGVLLALGAEQAVEWLHWRHQVETERRALLVEVRQNLDAVQERMVIQPCMDRRLSELKQVFERHGRSQPLRLIGNVGVPPARSGSRGTWSIAISGQTLTHVPYDEQTAFSNAFDNFENWDNIRRDERSAWVKLGALDDAAAMTEADWALLRQAYAEARAATFRVADVGPYVLQTASLGQKPLDSAAAEKELHSSAPLNAPGEIEICGRLF